MARERHELTAMRRRAVDRLLVRYLELPDDQQQNFLARCRKRWPRLSGWLARMTASGNTVTLLDDSVRHLANHALKASGVELPVLQAGTRLGPWMIVEEVGQGGMGMVYRGRRADGAFEMDVAIKLLRRRRRGLAASLQRESRFLARLNHVAITRLMDAGLDQGAGPFLVMEWVEGLDLGEWLSQTRPDLNVLLGIFSVLTTAVAHAHQRLIVHGDIKPSNIRIDSAGQVKLLDFGIARMMVDGQPSEDSVAALTPEFAAPEQFDGETVTTRSDIWSLGAVLFWLLTGRYDTHDRKSVETLIRQNGHRRAAELAAIVLRACADDPDSRYQSAGDLADDLKAWQHHRPLDAWPESRIYRATKFVRRNPVLLGGVLATALALGIGMVTTFSMYQQAAIERDRAEQHAQELAEVAAFQEAQLAGIDVERLGEDMRTTLLEMVLVPEPMLGETDPATRQRIDQFNQAIAVVNFTDYALKTLELGLFDRTRAAIDEMFQDQLLLQARLLQTLSTTLRQVGLVDEAIEPQHRALAIRRTELGPDHADSLQSMLQLVHLQVVLGQYEDALATLKDRLELQIPLLGDEHPDTLTSLNSIGSLYFYLGELEQTEIYYRRALEGRLRALGEQHGETAFTMTGLGAVLRDLGNPDKAETYLFRALEILEDVHGASHQRTRNTRRQIASTYIEQDRLEDAESQLLKLHEIERRALGDRHQETMHTLYHLGRLQFMMGRHEAAEFYLREALEGQRELLGEQHPQTVETRRLLADTLESQGKHGEGERLITEVGSPDGDL